MNCREQLDQVPAARGHRLVHWLVGAVLLTGLANATAADPHLTYTVKTGDKLIVLTRDLLARPTDWSEVARFNGMQNPHVIHPGQVLNIPLRLMKFNPVEGKLIGAEGIVRLGTAPGVAGSAINEGGQLTTGPNSSAVIELADGSRVQLLPGSLAEITSSREYALRDAAASGSSTWFSGVIRLTQGAVETLATKLGRRATPLQVTTPTTVVGVRGTRFRVAYEADVTRNSRAEVLEGAVRADNSTQQSGADLPRGTGAVIDPARKEILVVPLLPPPDLSALPTSITRLEARTWPLPVLTGAAAYRVQIAADAQFERISRDLKVTTAAVDLSSLADGNWHVRVRGIDRQDLEGFDSATQLTLRETPAPASRPWQVSDSRLHFEHGNTLLIWAGVLPGGTLLQTSTYSAELATDPQFIQIIQRPSASRPQFDLDNLKSGRYFIRITAGAFAPPARSETYQLDVPGNWGLTVRDLSSALQPVP